MPASTRAQPVPSVIAPSPASSTVRVRGLTGADSKVRDASPVSTAEPDACPDGKLRRSSPLGRSRSVVDFNVPVARPVADHATAPTSTPRALLASQSSPDSAATIEAYQA